MNQAEPDTKSGGKPSHAGGARWQRTVPWILGALVCLLYLGGELFYFQGQLGLPLDDSWIHMQFARNLAAGEGLSYNPGVLVSGTTAPLWTALLSLLFYLPGAPLVWVKLAGILLYLAGVEATRRLALELGLAPGWSALAAALTAATGWLVWSALAAMEIPLFIFLSLSGMVLHIRERRNPGRLPLSLGVFGAAILARPEGLLLIALAVLDRLAVPERDDIGGLRLERPMVGPILWGLLTASILVTPVALFNLVVNGTLLPTTFAAKSTGLERFMPNLQAVYQTLGIFFREQPLLTLAALGGCLLLVESLGRRRRVGLLPALWLVGLPLAYSVLGAPRNQALAGSFGRYFFPLFPVLIVLGILGIERAGSAIGWRLKVGSLRLPIGLILLAILVWPSVGGVRRGMGRFLQNVDNVQRSDVAIAHWLAERVAPEAVLAVNDVGAIKYFLPNQVLDLAGIINPEVTGYFRAAAEEGRDRHEEILRFLGETKPDYLVIFPGWYPGLVQANQQFRPLYALQIPGNITMGGNEIAVFSTPWTRYPLATPSSSNQ